MLISKIYFLSLYLRWIFKSFDIVRNFFTIQNNDKVKFLMYHSIGGNLDLELDIGKKIFLKQLAFLQKKGKIISIEESLDLINKKENDQKQYFVLTFDDGYSNFFSNVYPELIKRSIPATLFPALEFIDSPNQKPIQNKIKNKSWTLINPLSIKEVKTLNDSDLITIGSHGYSHFNYSNASIQKIDNDIKKASEWFLNNLGINPEIFCYPMGFSNKECENLLKNKFKIAFKASYSSPAYGKYEQESFPRIAILKSDGIFWFKLKINGFLYREHSIIRKVLKFINLD